MATNMEKILRHIDIKGIPQEWDELINGNEQENKIWILCGKRFAQYKPTDYTTELKEKIREITESPEDMCFYLATEKSQLKGIILRKKDEKQVDDLEYMGFKRIGVRKIGGVECLGYVFNNITDNTQEPERVYSNQQHNPDWRSLTKLCK